jgi:hypothetical protein
VPSRAWAAGLFALALAFVAAVLIVAAFNGDDDGVDDAIASSGWDVFVGKVSESDAYIALISDGKEMQGYVAADAWWGNWSQRAPVNDGRARLLSRRGFLLADVLVSGDGASGNVLMDGQSLAFEAERAKGDAGLYRATLGDVGADGSFEVGWVVLNDGSQRGTVTTYSGTIKVARFRSPPRLPRGGGDVQVEDAGKLAARRVTGFIEPNHF